MRHYPEPCLREYFTTELLLIRIYGTLWSRGLWYTVRSGLVNVSHLSYSDNRLCRLTVSDISQTHYHLVRRYKYYTFSQTYHLQVTAEADTVLCLFACDLFILECFYSFCFRWKWETNLSQMIGGFSYSYLRSNSVTFPTTPKLFALALYGSWRYVPLPQTFSY